MHPTRCGCTDKQRGNAGRLRCWLHAGRPSSGRVSVYLNSSSIDLKLLPSKALTSDR